MHSLTDALSPLSLYARYPQQYPHNYNFKKGFLKKVNLHLTFSQRFCRWGGRGCHGHFIFQSPGLDNLPRGNLAKCKLVEGETPHLLAFDLCKMIK